ncbi:LIM zinc-binding domain-containing protein [Balamuthia mandrillaris]
MSSQPRTIICFFFIPFFFVFFIFPFFFLSSIKQPNPTPKTLSSLPPPTFKKTTMSGAKPRWGGAPSVKCTGCQKTVYPAETVKMEGQIWHDKCLRCVECKKTLTGANWGGFVAPDNTPYCKIHYDRLVAASGSATAFSGSQQQWKPS